MNQIDSSLTLQQLAKLIQATPKILRSQLEALPEAVHSWRPEPGEWCINEVIGHMIEADRNGFDGRIRTILAEGRPQLKAWQINETAAKRNDCQRNAFDLVDELAAMRTRSAELIMSLKPEQLSRAGIHPTIGELVVIDLLHEWGHHDANHTRQILNNIRAFLWPKMGTTQKFFEPGKMPV
jgi:hypothetical protein